MQWFTKAWCGEEKLWKVFWVYGVLGGMAVNILCIATVKIVGAIGFVFTSIFLIAYVIWLLVSQWKCAFNLQWKFWGYTVRVLIVLWVLCVPMGVLTGGVLVGQDLIHAAECRVQMKKEAQAAGIDPDIYRAQHMDEVHKCAEKYMHHTTPTIGTPVGIEPPPAP